MQFWAWSPPLYNAWLRLLGETSGNLVCLFCFVLLISNPDRQNDSRLDLFDVLCVGCHGYILTCGPPLFSNLFFFFSLCALIRHVTSSAVFGRTGRRGGYSLANSEPTMPVYTNLFISWRTLNIITTQNLKFQLQTPLSPLHNSEPVLWKFLSEDYVLISWPIYAGKGR